MNYGIIKLHEMLKNNENGILISEVKMNAQE